MQEDQIVKPVDESIVLNFINKYYTDLKDFKPIYRGGGSYSAYTVGTELIFRFSKGVNNKESESAFNNEKNLLNQIRDKVVPHEVPAHLRFIQDKDIYDGSVWVSKQFSGQMLKSLIKMNNAQNIAKLIGDFLSKLHAIDYKQIEGFEYENVNHVDLLNKWKTRYDNDKDYYKFMNNSEVEYMEKVHDRFFNFANQMTVRNCIVHGDFDHSNCMMVPDLDFLQVIDCEDMGFGQEASDFCTWFGAYGDNFLEDMISRYNLPIDKYFRERVRFYWLRIPLNYFRYSVEHNNTGFINFGKELLQENMNKFTA